MEDHLEEEELHLQIEMEEGHRMKWEEGQMRKEVQHLH